MTLGIEERQTFDARIAQTRKIDPAAVIANSKRAEHDIRQIKVGGVFSYEGKTYFVTDTARYQETNDRFTKTKDFVATELVCFCLETGETRFFEWGVDDELEVSFTERKIPQAEIGNSLCYEDGEVVDLDDIDDIARKGTKLLFKGKSYGFNHDWSCRYTSPTGSQSCIFLAEFGELKSGLFTIEAWSDDGDEEGHWDYDVYLSVNVNPRAIEIISLGGS